jgi:uncharacterized protein
LNRFADSWKDRLPLWVTLLLVGIGLTAWLGAALGSLPGWALSALDWLSRFSVVFLGIFIEAAPFLLLGTLASGIVEVFVDRDALARWLPRSVLGGALAGSLFGLFFPVCECGVVPFVRRLMHKGVRAPVAVATLLAAPVLNPIVIASTLAAFGVGPVLWGRLGGTLIIATVVGVLFGLHPRQNEMLRSPIPAGGSFPSVQLASGKPRDRFGVRVRRVLVVAADEFF